MTNKNRINLIKFLVLICSLTFGFGATTACQSNQQAVKKPANSSINALSNNNSQSENVETGLTESRSGSLATPTEAYKTAFTLRQSKNIQGLKLVISKDMLDFFKLMADDHKTVDDQLKELVEQPQAASAEVRNEKISGKTANIEYLDETGKWKEMNFVKEGSDWKLSLLDTHSSITAKPTEKIYDNSTKSKSKF